MRSQLLSRILSSAVRRQQLTKHFIKEMTSSPALPPEPRPPAESDCCNSDCTLCVKDIYQQEVKIWQQECRNILLGEAPRSSLSPLNYTKCRVVCVQSITHDTSIYTFDCRGYVDILPGQHLIVREKIDGVGSLTRQYTPVSVPQPDDLTFKIMIKHYDSGLLTSHIGEKWTEGSEVEWRGPLGSFIHQSNKYMKYLMLAAGTGIAPMINIARAITADDDDITTIKLLYANRTYEDILLKPELKQLAQNWNFTYKMFFSQDADVVSKKSYGENVASRRIAFSDIQAEVTNVNSTRVLICGTREFDSCMLDYCKQLGASPDNLYKF